MHIQGWLGCIFGGAVIRNECGEHFGNKTLRLTDLKKKKKELFCMNPITYYQW